MNQDRIRARVNMLPLPEGRHDSILPNVGGYRPHLVVDGQTELLGVEMISGPAELLPGDSANVVFALLFDGVDYSALQFDAKFEIFEGARIVGSGVVVVGD